MTKAKPRKQCAKCPWKRSTDPHDIPNGYCEAKHRALADTIADPGALVVGQLRLMACPPAAGERCPLCHRGARSLPCLLCAPALVPRAHHTDLRRAAIDAARIGWIAGWITRCGAA